MFEITTLIQELIDGSKPSKVRVTIIEIDSCSEEPPPPVVDPPAGDEMKFYNSQGMQGIGFDVEKRTVGVNEKCWFTFKVTNSTTEKLAYAVLAAKSEEGPSAKSWTNETLGAGDSLEWRDHIIFTNPGQYHLYLGICYGDRGSCLAGTTQWDRLSSSLLVTVA